MRGADAMRCCVLCCFVVYICTEVATAWETNGQAFWLIIPSDGSSTVQNTVTVTGREGTSVTLSTMVPVGGSTNIIDNTGVLKLSLGVAKHDDIVKGINSYRGLSISTNTSCGVNVLVKGRDFALSFIVYPKATTFNIEYTVITSCHENITCSTTAVIVAERTSPSVTISFKATNPVKMNGNSYSTGETVSMYMFAYQVIMFTSKGDLTGSRIMSPVPLQVFSGSFCDKIDGVYACDISFEQMPPRNIWGSEYILSPVPFPVAGLYKAVVGTSGTTVSLPDETTLLLKAQEYFFVNPTNTAGNITSSFPILLALLLRHADIPLNYSSAMIIRQPLAQRQESYRVMSHADLENFLQVESSLNFHETGWIDKRLICNINKTEYIFEVGTVYTVPIKDGIKSIGCLPSCSPYDVFEFGMGTRVIAGSGPLRNAVIDSPAISEVCSNPETILSEYITPTVTTSVYVEASLSDMTSVMNTNMIMFATTRNELQDTTVSTTILNLSHTFSSADDYSSSERKITSSTLVKSILDTAGFLERSSGGGSGSVNNEVTTSVPGTTGQTPWLSGFSGTTYESKVNDMNSHSSSFSSWRDTPRCSEPTTQCQDTDTASVTDNIKSRTLVSSELMTSGHYSTEVLSYIPEPIISSVYSHSSWLYPSESSMPTWTLDTDSTAFLVSSETLVKGRDTISHASSQDANSRSNSFSTNRGITEDLEATTQISDADTESNMYDTHSLPSSENTAKGDNSLSSSSNNLESVSLSTTNSQLHSGSKTLREPSSLISLFIQSTVSRVSSNSVHFQRDHVFCTCPCLMKNRQDWRKSMDPILESLRQRLLLDKNTLSSEIRKRISAYDPRASATNLGAFGTAVLSLVFGCIFGSDLIVLLKHIIVYCSRHPR